MLRASFSDSIGEMHADIYESNIFFVICWFVIYFVYERYIWKICNSAKFHSYMAYNIDFLLQIVFKKNETILKKWSNSKYWDVFHEPVVSVLAK